MKLEFDTIKADSLHAFTLHTLIEILNNFNPPVI